MTEPGGDWDDARLAAAFAGRAARTPAPPADLVADVVDHVRPRGRTSLRLRWSFAAAAASVAIVVVAVAVVAPRIAGPGATASPPGSGDASAPSAPVDGGGVPDVSVSQALAIRDGGQDDRELTVTGYLGGINVAISCTPTILPMNPTRLDCPQNFVWLMERPESLVTATPSSWEFHTPTGPAIQPALGLFVTRTNSRSGPAKLRLLGHFDDRRALLCEANTEPSCADTFVVDRILAVDEQAVPVTTVKDNTRWDEATQKEVEIAPTSTDEIVDALVAGVASTEMVVSRLLLTGDRLGQQEPPLAGDQRYTSQRLVWLVTTVDTAQQPEAHTYLIVDGTTALVEVTATGPIARTPTRTPDPSPSSSADPFTGAPTSVFGIGVSDIRTVFDLHPQFDSAEVAVRGFFVPPDPAADCPGLRDPVRPVANLCFEGRHWLLDRPEQLWADPAKVGIDRQPTGIYLNPIVPFDVPMTVPDTWSDGTPEPWPVVLLGHFSDPRVRTYAANQDFVVDAAVWQLGDYAWTSDPGPAAAVVLTPPTETSTAVLDRLGQALGPARASWVTVLSGADLQRVDEDVEAGRSDLAAAPAVWVVRRLVDATDGAGITRPVVDTAFTVDGTNRIWERRDCCGIELRTTVDVDLPSTGVASELRVADDMGTVTAVRLGDNGRIGRWRSIGPVELPLAVAATDDPRELAIRWNRSTCLGTWQLHITADSWIGFSPEPMVEGSCPATETLIVVVTFKDPIDVGKVHTDESLSGG